jgi:hypothetical protein
VVIPQLLDLIKTLTPYLDVRKNLRSELTPADGVTKLWAPINKECPDNTSDYEVVTCQKKIIHHEIT